MGQTVRFAAGALLAGVVVLFTGCQWPPEVQWGRWNAPSAEPDTPPALAAEDANQPAAPFAQLDAEPVDERTAMDDLEDQDPNGGPGALVVRLRVVAIQVPLGKSSDSEELWSYLDEEPVNLGGNVHLGQNGFRVGVAPREAWPQVARVLRRLTGQKVGEHFHWMVPGRPTSIVLQRDCPVQTIFTFFQDGSLSGEDFPAGENVLGVQCNLNPHDREKVLLTALPQVRTRPRMRYMPTGKSVQLVNQAVPMPLTPLTFQVNLDVGDLLVVGPGPAALNETSAGHHFLTQTSDGMPVERVVVLVPTIRRVRVRNGPADLIPSDPQVTSSRP